MPFPDAKYPPKSEPQVPMQWQTEVSPMEWFGDHGEVYDGNNQVVCFMPTETHNGRDIYNVANAVLIASAPRLLERLKAMVSGAECECDTADPDHPLCDICWSRRVIDEAEEV